jgi:lipopolysaccharide export system protein LptA
MTARVRRIAGIAAASIALAQAGAALAQGIGLPNQSRDTPIEIHADEGIEWRQDAQAYIARGNARAAQNDTTVYADKLTAYYRKPPPDEKKAGEKKGTSTVGGQPQGGSEIIRIDADANVRIVSPRQTAFGDKAVYDVEKSILVLTGRPRMVTETDTITAKRSLEFWELKSMAVARGDAIAVRADKRLRADILTAHFEKDAEGKSEVRRIDAFDNVVITSPTEIVRGRQGVYDVKTGIAVLQGDVKITRGEDQLNGDAAEVNMNTGVSKMLSQSSRQVRGVFRSRSTRPGAEDGDMRKNGKTGATGATGKGN